MKTSMSSNESKMNSNKNGKRPEEENHEANESPAEKNGENQVTEDPDITDPPRSGSAGDEEKDITA